MADFTPKDFGSIGLGYANWRKMAGLDKSPFPGDQQSTGIAPPDQSVEQQWNTAKSQIAAIPGAVGNMMQGNFSAAANAFKPQAVAPVAITPIAQPVLQPPAETTDADAVDYMSMIWGTK